MIQNQRENGTPLASKNGETIRRNRTSCIQRDKCIESWEMRKRKNKDTIHYNGESVIVELLLSDYAHSESALCLRSSHKLVWNAGKNGIRESVEKSEHEHWGNQFFGEDTTSTTSFGEPNASETSKFRVSFSEKSTRTSLWKSNISSSSGEDLVLSDSFWCWRWMREPHPNVQRTHSSSWTSWI